MLCSQAVQEMTITQVRHLPALLRPQLLKNEVTSRRDDSDTLVSRVGDGIKDTVSGGADIIDDTVSTVESVVDDIIR